MAEQEYSEDFAPASIGERLRQGREAKGLALEDVASQTRIPIRHLQHIEREEWDALPAATYAVGFVRNYANAVGLDGAELSRELRDRLGGTRSRAPAPEYFQPADPARVPPRSIAIFAVLLAVVLIVGYLIWRSSISEEQAPEPNATAPVTDAQPQQPRPQTPPRPNPQSAAGQPVILTATGEVWLRISEADGATIVERTLQPGETLQIPGTAQRPMLRVGAPQSLRITVGRIVIPPVGPPGQPVDEVSLRPEDLIARAQGQAQPPAPTP